MTVSCAVGDVWISPAIFYPSPRAAARRAWILALVHPMLGLAGRNGLARLFYSRGVLAAWYNGGVRMILCASCPRLSCPAPVFLRRDADAPLPSSRKICDQPTSAPHAYP